MRYLATGMSWFLSTNKLLIRSAGSEGCVLLIGATVSCLIAIIRLSRDPTRRTRSDLGSIDFM